MEPQEPPALLPVRCTECGESMVLVVYPMPWAFAARRVWRCPYANCGAENSAVMSDRVLEVWKNEKPEPQYPVF